MLLRMEVSHQIVMACKAFVAQSAYVWLLAGVRFVVHLQHIGIRKRLATGSARIGTFIAMGATSAKYRFKLKC